MKLLAIDTSSNACSVALQTGADIFESHVVKPREHTKILLPMIEELLRDAGTALSGLDAVVLGNGPGSFIGMRIGASVAQGICHGAGLQIVPVSSLAAIAAEVMDSHGATNVLVAQDARMHEIYVGLYRRNTDDLPVAVGDEQICKIDELDLPDEKFIAAGGGWQKFPKLLAQSRNRVNEVVNVSEPRARYLLGLGGNAFAQGRAMAPERLVPAYLRMKVAEIPQNRDELAS